MKHQVPSHLMKLFEKTLENSFTKEIYNKRDRQTERERDRRLGLKRLPKFNIRDPVLG